MTAAGPGKSFLAQQLQSMLAASSGPQGSAGVPAPACSPGSAKAADASHSAAPSEDRTLPPRSLAPELAAASSGHQGSAGVPAPVHHLDYLRSTTWSPGSANAADAISRPAALSEVRTAPEHMTQDPLQHVAPPTTEGQLAEPSGIANEAMPPTGNAPPPEILSPAPSSPALSPEPELVLPSS